MRMKHPLRRNALLEWPVPQQAVFFQAPYQFGWQREKDACQRQWLADQKPCSRPHSPSFDQHRAISQAPHDSGDNTAMLPDQNPRKRDDILGFRIEQPDCLDVIAHLLKTQSDHLFWRISNQCAMVALFCPTSG